MTGLGIITLVGIAVIAVLVVAFVKLRRDDALGAIAEKRRAGSRLVTRAEYVEGVEKIPVVLSVTDDTFNYENADFDASFELDRLDEVEYTDDLATGKSFDRACRVLRLRSHGAAFEFLLPKDDCAKWMSVLPPRQLGMEPSARAV